MKRWQIIGAMVAVALLASVSWVFAVVGAWYNDDIEVAFGTAPDYKIVYDSGTLDLEITDGTNNLITITDSGTTGDLDISGTLTVDGASTLTGDVTATSIGSGTPGSGAFTTLTTTSTAGIATSGPDRALYHAHIGGWRSGTKRSISC